MSKPCRKNPAMPCPQCGALAMVRVRKAMRLPAGLTLPKLERYQCQECGANFFDDAAMETIEKAEAGSRAGIR